jgi:cytoskeletal protein RodZ
MTPSAVMNADINPANENTIPPGVAESRGDTVGLSLKHTREGKNVSLDEVSRATKIRKEFLVAIEADRLDSLPGDVFARGFVRSYADYLGMDGKAISTRAASGFSQAGVASPAGARVVGSNLARMLVLAAIGAVVTAWYLYKHGLL